MKIDCNIVQDLLPSYIDNLTSTATNNFIEQHMQDCKSCKEMLEDLQKDIQSKDVVEQKEINFLKKIKKRYNIIKICCAVMAAILICAGIQQLFSLSFPAPVSMIVITDIEEQKETGDILFRVSTNNPFFAVSGARFLPEKGTDIVYMTFLYKLENLFIKQAPVLHGVIEESKKAYGYKDFNAIKMVDDDGREKLIWEK